MLTYYPKLSSTTYSLVFSLASCFLVTISTAQDQQNTGERAQELKEQLASADKTDIAKNVKSASEHLAKQNALAAASTQRIDAGLKQKRDRVVALHAFRADYLSKVASGDIDPLQLWRDTLPELQLALPKIQQNYKSFLTTDDTEQKAHLQSALLTALQPFGFFLNNAQTRKTDLRLSADQVKQIQRLQDLQQNVGLTEDLKMRGLSFSPLSAQFTLLDLPIPLTLHAPADTKIYLESTTGGRFPNGLAFIELDSGPTGVVTTSWVSHGDSVADNTFYAVSTSGSCDHTVSVKGLTINFPVDPKELIKKAVPVK